ncbi:MAG: hypothetical protein ABFS28_07290 [Bacteroidota bacterium]
MSPRLVFLLILIVIGLIYDYHHIAFYKPVGIHQWRNSVSAAFPLNYYYGGNFFTPQTNALLSDQITSDVTVVEFPLIYFLISVFYRIFGIHVFWFRMFQVALGFLGLLYLFKASYYFTKNWFYAGVIPLIIFTSPIYAFYLNNYIPDAVALSLTFAGFYFFMKHSREQRFRPWVTAMCFFLLAGLTKTSSLLPFLGLGAVAFLDWILRNKRGVGDSYFRFQYKYIGSYLMVLVLVFTWYLYARVYSDVHGGSVSPVAIRPIWHLDKETIRMTLSGMKGWFRPGYYHAKEFLISTLFVLLITLVWIRKANRFLSIWNIVILLGAIAFTLLFFFDMRNHDYYQINNLFLLVSIYLTFFSIVKNALPRVYNSGWTKLAFMMVLVFLGFRCTHRMHYRYSERDMYYVSSSAVLKMYDIEDYLDVIGVDRSAKVYCTPDRSINISLYLCNRKGLTDYSRYRTLTLEERLEKMKEHDINYVILGSREHYKDVESLDQILGEKIGETGNTEIFKLNSMTP